MSLKLKKKQKLSIYIKWQNSLFAYLNQGIYV